MFKSKYNSTIKKKSHKKPSSFEEYITKKEFQKGTPVWLNIYHLTCLNYLLQFIGMGIYHTSIEIDSREYSFGSCKDDVPGFYIHEIGEIGKMIKLKEKIYMGNTIYKRNNIEKLLALESPFWMGRTYDPFLKNCNHFTKYFLKIILFNNINYPVYINRICKYAQVFSSFYPPIKRIFGNLNKRDTNGSVAYLAGEINYFLKKNQNQNLSRSKNDSDIILDDNIDLDIIREPIDFDNLKDNEKYFEEKIKNNTTNENITSSEKKSENISLNKEYTSRINLYGPKLIHIMNKDSFLFGLNYSSIYKTQIQGEKNIDINIESIYNFFKTLQETNDKLINICKINQNINSLFSFNNLNNSNSKCQFNENCGEYNKIGENIDSCFFLLDILIRDKIFQNKKIKINFDVFIRDNYYILDKNLIIDNKLMNIGTFLTLKILHMSNFIFFMSKNFNRQIGIVEKILVINQNDFYGLFSLAYIKLIQSNIPESSELINSLLDKKEIVMNPFYYYSLNFMKNLINDYKK